MLKEVNWRGRELERLAMMPDTVINVVMEVSEYEQEPVSSETGIGSAESRETASVGESG